MPLQDRQVTMCKYDGGKGTTNVSAQLNISFGGGRQLPSTKKTNFHVSILPIAALSRVQVV